MAATAISKVFESPGRGGTHEVWKMTLDIASIAADAQGAETAAIPGAKAGDPCWISCDAPNKHLIPQGAKVTADDVVTMYFGDNFTATTAVDNASQSVFLSIIKLSVTPAI